MKFPLGAPTQPPPHRQQSCWAITPTVTARQSKPGEQRWWLGTFTQTFQRGREGGAAGGGVATTSRLFRRETLQG